ncbi:MAG: hypothetical protein GY820_28710 [Gammaproteobacteria bacterium]|nr:hypothetical protein [Gammaproteobacteria bacterium]
MRRTASLRRRRGSFRPLNKKYDALLKDETKRGSHHHFAKEDFTGGRFSADTNDSFFVIRPFF